MAEHAKDSRAASESSLEKITDELQSHDSSSSDSISDPDKTVSPSSVKAKDFRLFGREKLVHTKISAGALGGAVQRREDASKSAQQEHETYLSHKTPPMLTLVCL
ncbi:hypothetical protein PVL29_021497 [Vitis rotundifolia]|uniref:Uncharacterized protein n=1 Tax=Vitis rotundifolia TaxID=103349 RepID=A0AA39D917_VITRO|nr:hypothetical protein PVL29_025063 [Vitis rotundifolia]KAJ9679589.1 hypothetical protein PVL29_021497 [Vitis rotundifolia]